LDAARSLDARGDDKLTIFKGPYRWFVSHCSFFTREQERERPRDLMTFSPKHFFCSDAGLLLLWTCHIPKMRGPSECARPFKINEVLHNVRGPPKCARSFRMCEVIQNSARSFITCGCVKRVNCVNECCSSCCLVRV